MSKNRHTKVTHESDRAQVARQVNGRADFERKLRAVIGPDVMTHINEAKERRRIRLEQKRLHKTMRSDATGTDES